MWRPVPAAVLVLILALSGSAGSRFHTQAQTPESTLSSLPSASSSPSPSPSTIVSAPSPEPSLPTPLPADPEADQAQPGGIEPAYPGSLRPGDWVQITGTGSCLNIHEEPNIPDLNLPGTYDNVVNCLPDGFVGRLSQHPWGGDYTVPVMAEGRWWWYILGQGWAGEEGLTFHHHGGIPWPERPDVANSGLIAGFTLCYRPGYLPQACGVWLMNADGSAKREILGSPGESTSFEDLRWSPGADRILLAVRGLDGQGNNTVASEIIDLNGKVLAEFPGVSDALWSPGGGRLSAFRVNRVGGPGGYDVTAPVVIGLGTGVETTIGPDFFPQDGTVPTWSRDGNSLAWVCTSDKMTWADNVPIEPKTNCGGDGLRISAADGSGSRVLLPMDFPGPFRPSFGNASWSPSGDTIALWASQAVSGCLGYIFVDAASGTVDRCIQLPRDSRFPDGNCGTIDGQGAGYWTPDGVRFIFAGRTCEHQSGVFVHDLVLARTVMIPSRWPRHISLAANGRDLAFASDGYIWMVGLDGSSPALLAEGGVFSWKPLP